VRTLPYLMWRVVSLPGCTLLWAFPVPLKWFHCLNVHCYEHFLRLSRQGRCVTGSLLKVLAQLYKVLFPSTSSANWCLQHDPTAPAAVLKCRANVSPCQDALCFVCVCVCLFVCVCVCVDGWVQTIPYFTHTTLWWCTDHGSAGRRSPVVWQILG
jgi:hypothetical protein